LKRTLLVASVIALLVVVTPAASSAAPPILQSVSFDNKTHVLSATWSLPPGVESRVLEANANPALDSDGYFLYGSNDGYYGPNILFELPDGSSTSWLHSYPDLPPGHYYVHVAGYDSTCTSCPIREWTGLGAFDVKPPPPPPPQARRVFAPDCVGKPHFKPGAIIVACGDGNLQLLRMRWSRWTGLSASGLGLYRWNDCVPACYRGHFHTRAGAHVTLSRVTRCRSKGFWQFTRMRVTPPPSLPRFKAFTQKLSCNYR
jgi:hypothetical protein